MMNAAITRISILLLLLVPIASADLIGSGMTCLGTEIALATSYNSPLLLAALGIAALIAIAYMASQMMEKPEWSVWAKTEAVSLGWSLVLIGAVMGGFVASCGLAGALVPGLPVGATPAMAAADYLDSLTANYGLPLASQMVKSSIDAQLGAMYYAYFGVPVLPGAGGLAYRANKRAWASQWDLLADLYIPLLFSLQAQKMALTILVPGIVGMLLPAALLLRMIFITRDVGNLLIAFCFALYFAFPLMYVLSAQATEAVVNQLGGGSAANPLGSLALAKDRVVGDAFQRVGFLATQAILFPNLALVVVVTMTMALNKALKGFVG